MDGVHILRSRKTMMTKARNMIKSAKYARDTDKYEFDDYCHNLLSANNDLIRCKVVVDAQTAVLDFLRGITRP